MASYTVNPRAVAHVRRLIGARQYVLDSDWGEVQLRADDENAFLANRHWTGHRPALVGPYRAAWA